jgi:CubicO group peptidase (beta-lactamase class C family)
MYSADGTDGIPANYDRAKAYTLQGALSTPLTNTTPDDRLANPNSPPNNPNVEAPRENNSWKVLGGGIEMHAVDLARFGWMLQNGEIVSNTTLNNELWSSLTVGAAGYNSVAPTSVGSGGNLPGGGVGMAWNLGGLAGVNLGRWVRHGGVARVGGAGSYIKIYRDLGIVIAMLSNRRYHVNMPGNDRNGLMDALATIVSGATPP